MAEHGGILNEPDWEAGFEGDRSVVVARLGPYQRLFSRPRNYSPRFFHRIYELRIEDWAIPLAPLPLGPWCTIEASLNVRFQPTLKYACEHPERLPDLGAYIRESYEILLRDAAEQELRALEGTEWLDRGFAPLERRIENLAHELLAMRNIQCRSRCTIETLLAEPEQQPGEHPAGLDPRHEALYRELLRRRRERHRRLAEEQYEQQLEAQRLRLAHEERMLELVRQETELRRRRQDQESERVRTELSADEMRLNEQFVSEIRLREERIRHEARLRQMELDADLAEKSRRAEALGDVENHLRREIELLALERQRLMLEEEVQDARVARAKGWVVNARRRFPLGENPGAQDGELSDEPSRR